MKLLWQKLVDKTTPKFLPVSVAPGTYARVMTAT
jgi:hypothetical protein